jgi:hypothetical protein
MKSRALLITLAVLVGAILWVNLGGMDWLRQPPIQIGVRNLAGIPAGGVEPLVFLLNRQVRLKSLRVVSAREALTNSRPHAAWDLVADEASAPLTQIVYGAPIPGMKPRFGIAAPEKLEPNQAYVIAIEVGKRHSRREFVYQPAARR